MQYFVEMKGENAVYLFFLQRQAGKELKIGADPFILWSQESPPHQQDLSIQPIAICQTRREH